MCCILDKNIEVIQRMLHYFSPLFLCIGIFPHTVYSALLTYGNVFLYILKEFGFEV